jgi:hypothetical protein
MEYKPVEQLRTLADLRVAEPACLTRRERLERWAEVLEREPDARLRSLGEIEFHPREERPLMRADDSPLTVAYADPVLRAAGLRSDTLGDAMLFFDLSERQAHRLLCSCMNGWSISASRAGAQVRHIANPDLRLRAAAWSAGAVAAAGAPALLYLFG